MPAYADHKNAIADAGMKDWLANPRLKRAAQLGLGFLAAAIALLSLVHADYRPDIGVLSGKLEHASAYFMLGALTVIAARQTQKINRLALAIVAYAGILELGQVLIPSRIASIEDFVASAVGAILGVLITASAVRQLARRV